MTKDKLEYPLENEEVDDIINYQDSLFNHNEVSVGSNDIIDRRSYMPGDKEIVDEIANTLGLAD